MPDNLTTDDLKIEIERLRDLLRGFRAHYGQAIWHDRVYAELGPVKESDYGN